MSKVKSVLVISPLVLFLMSCATKQCGKTGCYAWEQVDQQRLLTTESDTTNYHDSFVKTELLNCASK